MEDENVRMLKRKIQALKNFREIIVKRMNPLDIITLEIIDYQIDQITRVLNLYRLNMGLDE